MGISEPYFRDYFYLSTSIDKTLHGNFIIALKYKFISF